MATVRLIPEEEATGRVREVYEDIKRTKRIDRVPDLWRALANSPDLLEQTWTELKRVMGPGRLDPLVKEMVALAVSVTNGCAYCINSHTAAVRKLGMDDDAFGEFMAVVALFNKTNRLADGFQVEPDVRPPVE